MGRMLGIIGTPPLPVQDAMRAFYPHDTQGGEGKDITSGHLGGWGASGFKDRRAVYFERRSEPAGKNQSEYALAQERALKSLTPILIVHFLQASGAGPGGIANTHPFHQQDWVFAHSGTIFGPVASFPLNETQPQGDTDSERFFYWMWEQMHASLDPSDALADLLKKSREQLVYSSLNFLMSDGNSLWAYRDVGEKRLGAGETLQEREKYYALFTTNVGPTSAVCSEPLPAISAVWEPLAQRTLAVFTPKCPSPQLIRV